MDGLSEISVELNTGETVAEYFANSIPRVEEFIEFESKQYRIYTVTHVLVKEDDGKLLTYARVGVQFMKYI